MVLMGHGVRYKMDSVEKKKVKEAPALIYTLFRFIDQPQPASAVLKNAVSVRSAFIQYFCASTSSTK